MPTLIQIQGTISYGTLPLVVLFLLLVISMIIYKKKKKQKSAEADKSLEPTKKNIPPSVKRRYVNQLSNLLIEYKGGKRDKRDSYQLLSHFLREFFYEYAGVDVTRKTLAEIRGIHNLRLEQLIEEYYACEFSEEVNGDIEKAVRNTINAIENW